MDVLHQLGDLFLQSLPTVVIVFLFYLFLRRSFFKPLGRVLAERRARSEGARGEADAMRAGTQETLRAYREALRRARGEIYAEQESARRAALEDRNRAIQAARSAANKEIHAAKQAMVDELNAARAELEISNAMLAGEIARAILERRPRVPQPLSEAR